MRFSAVITACVALAAVPTNLEAQSYHVSNGMTVQGGRTDFSVLFKNGALERAYWCAAAGFVIDGLGLSPRTRLFRATPTPRKQGQGIGFTLDPAKAVAKNGLTVFGSPDGTVSAGYARSIFCDRDPFFDFF